MFAKAEISFRGSFHGGGGQAPTLRQIYTVALQNAVYDFPHCAEPIHLLIQLSLFFPRQFLPPTRGWNTGTEAMQQMARHIQAKATRLRESNDCKLVGRISGITTLPAGSHGLG